MACVALAALIATGPAHAAATLQRGHSDLAATYSESEGLGLVIHVDAGARVDGAALPFAAEYLTDELVIELGSPAAQTVSQAALAAGTGVPLGAPFWVLPEGNHPLLPFFGLNTGGLIRSEWIGDLSYQLVTVNSPSGLGQFAMYQSDGLGGWLFWMSTADGGISTADRALLPPSAHSHYNFSFSETGTWTLGFTLTGQHALEGLQTSSEHTLTFHVTPEPSRALLILGGFASLLLRRSRWHQNRTCMPTLKPRPGMGATSLRKEVAWRASASRMLVACRVRLTS
jgi:surface-anchored protein